MDKKESPTNGIIRDIYLSYVESNKRDIPHDQAEMLRIINFIKEVRLTPRENIDKSGESADKL